MVAGDRFLADIAATISFSAALPISERGKSPIFGFSQLRTTPSQLSSVEFATGFRFRHFSSLSQSAACSRNVMPFACLTTLLKCASVSAPLSAMISRAQRSRADLDRVPGPLTGQILARLWALFSCPGTSIHHRTTHHLPLCSMCPDWPVLRDMLFPPRLNGIAETTSGENVTRCNVVRTDSLALFSL